MIGDATRSPSDPPVRLPASAVAERLFGVDLWETPAAILDAVFAPSARVAVKACHASSKTHTAALAVALALYEGADVLTTAPTWEQVKSVLWGEVHRLLGRSLIPPAEWGAINQTDIAMPGGARALGLSTNEGVRFQGWHARPGSFLLVIFDEAPGVRPDIYEAVEGISAGGDVRHLLLGNPVTASGPFYDLFASAAQGWLRVTIDAFDTPNLRGLGVRDLLSGDEAALDLCPRPYLVARRWVRDRLLEWGEDHPLWQSRVRGRFPLQADDGLISLAWLERAGRPARHDPTAGPVVAGVDVAGPGEDETVVCVRQGDAILELAAVADADARGAVVDALRPWRHRGLDAVNVDAAGIGHYLARHLEDLGIPVRDVNVGAAPTTDDAKERYKNRKAEYFWHLRGRLRDGDVSGLADRAAVAQLAGIRYAHDARGRVEIERKEDARRRGVASPDRAEAIMLAFCPPDPAALRARLYGLRSGRG